MGGFIPNLIMTTSSKFAQLQNPLGIGSGSPLAVDRQIILITVIIIKSRFGIRLMHSTSSKYVIAFKGSYCRQQM